MVTIAAFNRDYVAYITGDFLPSSSDPSRLALAQFGPFPIKSGDEMKVLSRSTLAFVLRNARRLISSCLLLTMKAGSSFVNSDLREMRVSADQYAKDGLTSSSNISCWLYSGTSERPLGCQMEMAWGLAWGAAFIYDLVA